MTNFDFSRVVYDEDGAARTSDVIAVTIANDEIEVLLIKRGTEPFLGQYAVPGGFLESGTDDGPAAAAVREVEEETGLKVQPPAVGFEERHPEVFELNRLLWLGMYNTPGRDPRFQTRTDCYWVALDVKPDVLGGDDAAEAKFVSFDSIMDRIDAGETVLAFDHDSYLLDLRETMLSFGPPPESGPPAD